MSMSLRCLVRSCCCPAGSTARCSPPRKPGRMLSIQFMSPQGSHGKPVSSVSSRTPAGAPAVHRRAESRPAARAPRIQHARRVPALALGAPGHSASLRHARRGCLSSRPQRRAAVQGRRLRSRPQHLAHRGWRRWPAIRFPMRRPQFFSALNSALSLGLAAPIEISAPFARPAQRGCGEDRRRAGGAVRADAFVHEPLRHDPLRAVQQVPRAKRRVSRRRHQGSDQLRERQSSLISCVSTQRRKGARFRFWKEKHSLRLL